MSFLISFLKRRLDKNKFFGLPATLIFFVSISTFFLFAGIVKDVISSEAIVSIDSQVANFLVASRNMKMTNFFLWVTLFGEGKIVLCFLFAIIGILWLWRKRLYIMPFFFTVAGSVAFTLLGKIIIRRSRPDLAVYLEHSFSFPSGHSTVAMAFYGFFTYLLVRNVKDWKKKVILFFVGSAMILFIGFSRLYLGVHYVSDVFGGYLIGVLWLAIGVSTSEWLRSMKENVVVFVPQKRIRIFSIVLILISFLFYLVSAINYHP